MKSYKGDIVNDDRGRVSFVNDFDFKNIKRFYMLENFSTETVRAFHGHMKEEKYVYVVSGEALVCLVKLTSKKRPSRKQEVARVVLSGVKPQVLHIPKGYANGFKVLSENTKIMFFSTSTLEESKDDDYRFPYDYWGEDIWKTENR